MTTHLMTAVIEKIWTDLLSPLTTWNLKVLRKIRKLTLNGRILLLQVGSCHMFWGYYALTVHTAEQSGPPIDGSLGIQRLVPSQKV